MLLSSISSRLMLFVFVCRRLDINLITFNLVFPTGGSNTPHVVFITLFYAQKKTGYILKETRDSRIIIIVNMAKSATFCALLMEEKPFEFHRLFSML